MNGDRVTLYLGDCLDIMPTLPAESVDSVVTDPPYGLEFMGRDWDKLGATHEIAVEGADRSHPFRDGTNRVRYGQSAKSMQAWHEQWATEAFRVLKPGGYFLAFGGTRTYHRLASAIEDAGFEIRDTLMWIYASGFPKSLDVSKALDKVAGAEREQGGTSGTNCADFPEPCSGHLGNGRYSPTVHALPTLPATDLARKWEGWGTALKPAHEPIVLARKPLVGTVAANVTRYGTGALNIDGTRIGTETTQVNTYAGRGPFGESQVGNEYESKMVAGRWPSNVLLSDSELFDEPNPGVVGSGATSVGGAFPKGRVGYDTGESWGKGWGGKENGERTDLDSGGYSRFFIIPKADRAERERGLAGAPKRPRDGKYGSMQDGRPHTPEGYEYHREARANVHPTVKPIDLMRHLVRLVTPPGGVVLDPFLGSGTTALAASEEGFHCIGIEREPEYLEIAKARLVATPMGFGL